MNGKVLVNCGFSHTTENMWLWDVL